MAVHCPSISPHSQGSNIPRNGHFHQEALLPACHIFMPYVDSWKFVCNFGANAAFPASPHLLSQSLVHAQSYSESAYLWSKIAVEFFQQPHACLWLVDANQSCAWFVQVMIMSDGSVTRHLQLLTGMPITAVRQSMPSHAVHPMHAHRLHMFAFLQLIKGSHLTIFLIVRC